ncbi:TPA: AraC family transcriptional regulator [Escherichia coli]|nr:AraC family transcriptional regulator [Escherichia coli]
MDKIYAKNVRFYNCVLIILNKACLSFTFSNGESVSVPEGSIFFIKKNTVFDVTLNNHSDMVSYQLYNIDNDTAKLLVPMLNSGVVNNKANNGRSIFIRNRSAIDRIMMSRLLNAVDMTTSDAKGLILCKLAYILSQFSDLDEITLALLHSVRKNTSDLVKELVENNLSRRWSLNLVSRELNRSEVALRKSLESEGVSFNRLLTDIRMMYSARQLAISNKNVNQICSETGYSSISYFIKKFHEYFGVTPKQYILKIKCNK